MSAMETGHTIEQTKSKIPAQIGVSITFALTSWITTATRLWIRRGMIKSVGLDDYFIILSTFFITAYAGCLMHISHLLGSGAIEEWEGLKQAADFVIICEVMYLQTVLWLKLSLGFFFLRIVNQKWQKNLCYGIMVFSTLINVTDTFFVIFMCGNPHMFLQRYITGQCTSHRTNLAILYTQAATTTLTDLVLAVLPVFVLWHVQMNKRKKLSVGFILSLGLIGTVCSSIRFNYIEGFLSIDDFFWSASSTAVWSMIEPGVGIMAANLATMRPLFKRFLEGAKKAAPSATAAARRMSRSFKHSMSMDRSFLNASLGSGLDHQRSSLVPPDRVSEDSAFGVTTTCIGGWSKSEDVGGNGLGRKLSSAAGSIRMPAATLQGIRGVGRKLTSAVGGLQRGRNEKITVGWDADPEKDAGSRTPPYLDIKKNVDVDIASTLLYSPTQRDRGSLSSGPTLVGHDDLEKIVESPLEKRGSQDSQQETLLAGPRTPPTPSTPPNRRVTFLDDASQPDLLNNHSNDDEDGSTFEDDFRRLYRRFL